VSQPDVYVGYFDAVALQGTYLDTTEWGKGQLFVNGFNLGRYWPKAGPQVKKGYKSRYTTRCQGGASRYSANLSLSGSWLGGHLVGIP
jgi:hypothetical protein